MKLPSTLSDLNSKFFPKKFLIFFPKKPALKNFPTFSPKSFSNIQETELSHIFLKNLFLVFWERYVQNPDIFKTRSILRNLAYLELEAYSQPSIFRTRDIFRTLSNIYDGTFCKNSYQAHSPSSARKIFT